MSHTDDELAEVLTQRALAQFSRSGLGDLFTPNEANPATFAAYADLREIVLDAFLMGQKRLKGYATPIDEDLDEAREHMTAADNAGG